MSTEFWEVHTDLKGNVERDTKAFQLAASKNIQLIWQDPVHEAFLLRHFANRSLARPTKARAEIDLKNVLPNYSKGFPSLSLVKALDYISLLQAAGVEPDLDRFLISIGMK